MRSSNHAPRSDFISLANSIGDLDVDVWQRLRELQKERFESRRPSKFAPLSIHQAMGNSILRKQTVNCVDLLFIPHLLEPFVSHVTVNLTCQSAKWFTQRRRGGIGKANYGRGWHPDAFISEPP